MEPHEAENGGDAFDDVTFDDDFVQAALIKEPSAAVRERLPRIHEERLRMEQQRASDLEIARQLRRRAKVTRVVGWVTVVLIVAALVGGAWLRSRPDGNDAPRPPVDRHVGASEVVISELPPPPPLEQATPIGTPPPPPALGGAYRFMRLQPDGLTPVAYDPCQPIFFVINPRAAPQEGERLVRDAFARLSEATGLRFVEKGVTDEIPSDTRAQYQPERYPGSWAPVLVAWSDEDEQPVLAGDYAGQGGSAALTVPGSTQSLYVGGQVVLDGPQFNDILDRRGGLDGAQAVILHELGHLVGLDHIDDSSELMNAVGDGSVTDYADGDLMGLALLGRGQCFPGI